MNAVIYTRFSPRRNSEESESCETQEALCRQHAQRQHWPVRAVFEDRDMSGSDASRPGLREAIASLQRGDCLLVYKRDRLARDVMIAELTRRQVAAAGATIAAVSGDIAGDDKDPTVMFVRQIMDAVAELERKQIACRTSDSMRQHQRNGRRIGRWAPYGTSLDPMDPTRLIANEDEERAVLRIRELADAGHGVAAIRRILNVEMPGASRCGEWGRNAILRIMGRMDAT